MTIEPLRVPSLKDAAIARLEELVLSGEWQAGTRLPSERDLAEQLGISRPVLHEALVDLAAKGLVRIEPRRGVFINDFRTSGSLAILSSLLAFQNGQLDPTLKRSLLAMRVLLEDETARLAALNRTSEHLETLQSILEQEAESPCDPQVLTELDFNFHLQIALASGNLVYPLIINSFQSIYTSLSGSFFQAYCGTDVVKVVFDFHKELVQAIRIQNSEAAAKIMLEMLRHGESLLKG
ncbi:MAG TPA: FadR/GntR family transcriptional regulator [Longilinea sp.]|nr:FadR/GntR family transcriptional regulator [Longilinea sp.]